MSSIFSRVRKVEPALTPEPAKQVRPRVLTPPKTKDRHPPGYMAEYMRKRRAAAKK
jgi:hypothetical protein